MEVAPPAQRPLHRTDERQPGPHSPAYQRWRQYLGDATRALAIAATSNAGFVISGLQAHGGSQNRPVLLSYRTQHTRGREEFSLARVVMDASSPATINDEHYAALHLHPTDGVGVCVFGGSAYHQRAGALPGCGKIVYDPSIGGVAGLVPIASADPFLDAQADSINASLARRRIRGWRLTLLSLRSGEVSSFQIAGKGEPEITLTGELWQPAGGLIPVGVSRDYPDGRRQLGICLLRIPDGASTWWWDDDYDLHTAVPDTEGKHWALRASTRWHDDWAPLRHELWCWSVAGGRGGRRVLDDGRQQWRSPLAWSDDLLLAAHQRDGVRHLEIFDHGGWRTARLGRAPGRQDGSVSSAAVAGSVLVTIESTVTSPPAIRVRPFPRRRNAGVSAPSVRCVDQVAGPPVRASVKRRVHQVAAAGIPHRTSSVAVLPAYRPARGVVAFFHGGPTMSWSDWSWRWNPLPFVGEGYAVILVDPAGSDGYGEKARAVAWRGWRSGIVPSALAVLNEARVRYDLVDLPLATMGGSFGGYLAVAVAASVQTVLVAAHATPFEPASISLSSDAYWSWTREWGPLAGGAAELTRENLGVEDLNRRTQLLLSHGMLDDQVPFQQSVKAARAMRLRGGRCQLALLADVGHAIGQPKIIDQWTTWVLAALEREIGGGSHE